MKLTRFPNQKTPIGSRFEVADLEDFYSYLHRNLQSDPVSPAAFTLATFRGNHRQKEEFEASSGLIAIDFEGPKDAPLTEDQLDAAVARLNEYGYIFYTSRSHLKPGKGARGRVILEVSPVPRTGPEHEALVKYLFTILPEGTYDTKCTDVSRLFFFPPEDTHARLNEGGPFIWDPTALPKETRHILVPRPTVQVATDEGLDEFVEIARDLALEADGARNNLALWILGAFKESGAPDDRVQRMYEQIFEGFQEHLDLFEARWTSTLERENAKAWGPRATEFEPIPVHKAEGLQQCLGMIEADRIRAIFRGATDRVTRDATRRPFPVSLAAYNPIKSLRHEDAVDAILATHFPPEYPLKSHQGDYYYYNGVCYVPVDWVQVKKLIVGFYSVAWGVKKVKNKSGEESELPVPLYQNGVTSMLREVREFMDLQTDDPVGPRRDLVCVRNGILDPKQCQVYPHDPKYFVVGEMPWTFLPEAEDTPELDAFYERCKFSDRQRAAHLEAIGYACFGQPKDVQKAVLLTGPPRAGKGTTGELICNIVGRENTVSLQFQQLGQDFGLQTAVNKKILYFDDVLFKIDQRHVSQSATTERFLSITTGKEVSINRKGQKHIQESLGTLVMCSNEIPRFGGAAASVRFHVVPFTESFSGKEDYNIVDRLVSEIDAIARRAWDAWQLVQARGKFTVAEGVDEIKEEIESGESSVAIFMREVLEPDPEFEAKTTVKQLYERYVNYCEDAGIKAVASRGQFKKDLTGTLRIKVKVAGNNKYYAVQVSLEERDA